MAKFNRILLKLSGESLMGEQGYGIDVKRLNEYAAQIKEGAEMGVQIGIVIGGGNIFRGLTGAGKGFDRVKGDQMGMMATVINSLALSSALACTGKTTKDVTTTDYNAYLHTHFGNLLDLCRILIQTFYVNSIALLAHKALAT